MAVKRDVLLASADKLVARGKLDVALKEYLRILEENPNDFLVLNKVGDVYVQLNRPGDSIAFFRRIAEHYARDGFFLKAIAIYKKINKLDPSQLDVYAALADLYHKQGLLPDARAQYQTLADFYLKQNQSAKAIEVVQRMASIDPGDIKIAVRLADLLTGAGRADEALMQYGVIGSMLVTRGAVDEAVAVYQKALRIRPADPKILDDLVRSLLSNGSADAAVLLLRAQPRSATTMALMAESLQALGNFDEAEKTAAGAIAFDPNHVGARQLLASASLKRGDARKAFEWILPLVDAAVRVGEIRRAISTLVPLLQGGAAARNVILKYLELARMAGDRPMQVEAARMLVGDARRSRDSEAAAQAYQIWLELEPENPEARTGAQALRSGRQAESVAAPPTAPEPQDLVIEIDDAAFTTPAVRNREPTSPYAIDFDLAGIGPGAPDPAAALENTAVRRLRADDAAWKDSVTEAEVFAKYGLIEKAAEKYRTLLKRRKDDLPARRRFVELLAETRSPNLRNEAEALISALAEAGLGAEADAAAQKYLGALPAAAASTPRQSEPPVPERSTIPPAGPLPSFVTALDFDEFSSPVTSQPEPGPPPPTPASVPPLDLEFAIDAQLGKAIGDEMARFSAEPARESAEPLKGSVDEKSLFSDEEQFFNLAAELERELSEEEGPAEAPMLVGADGDVSLEEIFREFKKGVEQSLSPEDYETHYNLGIAYKEMGLLDEAIGEFQIASKDPARAVECCSMLGLCFLEKGIPALAIQWFQRGLASASIKPEERLGLQYDLGSLYEETGDGESAYRFFLDVYGQNTQYRDVADRVKSLEALRGR